MKKSILTCLFVMMCCIGLYANGDSLSAPAANQIKIDTIIIIGNKITDDDIILRELTFNLNDTVDIKTLKYNEDRIYSLGIFNIVKLQPSVLNGKTTLTITVKESWYIWPLPFANLTDRSWDKITYGFDINVKNFRGKNEILRTRFGFGYNPTMSLLYVNPLLFKTGSVSLRIDMNYAKIKNINAAAKYLYGEDFDQKNYFAAFTLGSRINLFHYFSLQGGYQYVETPKYIKNISVSGDRTDRIYFAGIGYAYDSRDLIQFPLNGLYLNTSYILKGMGINNIDYKVLGIDFREYRSLYKDLSAKWRFYMRQTYGENIPYFDYSYLGYAERIRGHFKTETEGNNAYLASVELKYPIVKEWNLEFNFPLVPKSLQTYRVAFYMQAFYDAGTTTYKDTDFRLNNFMSGYGLGFTMLLLPYNMARIEMGFDEKGRHEWILDVGISF